MSFTRLPLCILTVAVIAGCSSSTRPMSSGNPFDEPLAAPEVVDSVSRQPPLPVPATPQELPNQVELSDGASDQPVESDVQVYAVDEAPYSSVSIPSPAVATSDPSPPGQTQPTTTPSQADEVLQEARRVGRTGDVMGQLALLEQSGYMGNPDAFYELAKIYLTGIGVEKAPDAAVGYLNSAMNLGHSEATRVLGWLYVMGNGVGKDVAYGEMLLAKSAETSVRAKREFGMALTNQRIPHLNDMERGLEYLKSASEAGDTEAAKAFAAAFTANPASAPEPEPSTALSAGADTAKRPDEARPRQAIRDGGDELEQLGRTGDTSAIYQYALNLSLGRIRAQGDPQFKAYCWYSVAAARGYGPAREEVRSLAGVRTLADKKYPGRMDACIAELNAAIDG